MGLHLNYEIRLPAEVPRAEVASLLSRLRDLAAATRVDDVSPLVDLATDDTAADPDSARRCVQFFADCLSKPLPDDELPRYAGDPRSALGFRVDPGDGAETATFGLMRRRAEHGDHEEWFWWCGCKTQYASLVSNEHLVKVHTSLVEILDAAVALGFDIVVRDETGYWESRSTDMLIEAVAEMNRVVARFAGAFSDAIGDEHDVQAPIFEHRNFERLEMGE